MKCKLDKIIGMITQTQGCIKEFGVVRGLQAVHVCVIHLCSVSGLGCRPEQRLDAVEKFGIDHKEP